MTDTLSPAKRSERMGKIRSKNTKPEILVRKMVYAMGFRYRLHDPNLPGKPDMVFTNNRKVIFVHDYSRSRLTVMMVRELAPAREPWDVAVAAFHAARKHGIAFAG